MNCALCKQPIESKSLCKRCQKDWRSEVQSALNKRDVNTVVLHLSKLLPGMVRAAINRMFPGMPGRAFKHWHEEGVSVATSFAFDVLDPSPRILPLRKIRSNKNHSAIKDADHLQAYFAVRCRSLVRDIVTKASSGNVLPEGFTFRLGPDPQYLEAIKRLAELTVRLAPERLQSVLENILDGMALKQAIKCEGERRAALGIKHGFLKTPQRNKEVVRKELCALGLITELAADEDDMRLYRQRWEPVRRILLYEMRRECAPGRSPLSSNRDDAA
jgi:hypothetical protein